MGGRSYGGVRSMMGGGGGPQRILDRYPRRHGGQSMGGDNFASDSGTPDTSGQFGSYVQSLQQQIQQLTDQLKQLKSPAQQGIARQSAFGGGGSGRRMVSGGVAFGGGGQARRGWAGAGGVAYGGGGQARRGWA